MPSDLHANSNSEQVDADDDVVAASEKKHTQWISVMNRQQKHKRISHIHPTMEQKASQWGFVFPFRQIRDGILYANQRQKE